MEWLYGQLSTVLSQNAFFQGGILLGAITWVFYQIKAVPMYGIKKLRYWASYTVHFDEQTDFYRQFTRWFNSKYPQKFRNVEVQLYLEEDDNESFRTHRRDWNMRFQQFSDTNFVWYQNRMIWVTKSREKLEGARDAAQAYRNSYTLTGLFARDAIKSLCHEILQQRLDEVNAKGLRIATKGNWDGWEIRQSPMAKGFDQLFFEGKDRVIADIDQFAKRKEFYAHRRINYKRCYLFYGPGGTGKSSVAGAIADHLGHDLYVINLGDISSNSALVRLAAQIPPKSTVVMEDIDCILNNRGVKNDKVNFSTVLNFLDGPTAPTECVMVLTTNHPEVLDDALVRKGRVDFSLKIEYPGPKEVEEFMTWFYDTPVSIPGNKRLQIPMSEVQEICMQNPPEEAVKLVQKAKAESFKSKPVKKKKPKDCPF